MRVFGAVLTLFAAQASAAVLTRGPYLQLADATGITVVFRTDVPSIGTVRYGPGLLTSSQSELVPTTEHVIRLGGLTPSTRYGYEVAVDGVTVAGGDGFRFRTHPPAGSAAPFRLFAWGDSGTGTVPQLAIAERMAGEVGDATLSLILGDIIYDVGQAELYDDRFFSPYASLLRRMVVWPAIGNHDVALDPLGGAYLDAFVLPTNNPVMTELYYSFDYGDAHFVCLDTHVTGHAAGSAQLQWAAADLAASNARWKFVYFHVPPYTGGTHADDPGVIAGIVPLVEAAGVDVVFAGHSHVYERTYLLKNSAIAQNAASSYVKATADAGTLYVVSGTAGQTGGLGNPAHPLMAFQAGNVVGSTVIDVAGDTLRGYFLRDDGTAVDLFQLSKGADTSAPRLLAARALSPTRVELSFDEPVLATAAERASPYSIVPPVAVQAATLGGDRRTVRLDTALHANGAYSITATGVGDEAGNASSSSVSARYDVAPSLVLTGSTVSYLVPTSGMPANWERPDFDDSSWSSGAQPIGYGASSLMTTVAMGSEVTLYTRTHFTPVVPLSRLRELTLELDYDDGFVAYLNGVELSRQNVLAQQTRGSTASASRERGLLEHRLVRAPPQAILVPGDNVLAIEVHNASAGSSDLFLNARLRAVLDGEFDGGVDAGDDGGFDAGSDAGADGGHDAGIDAGADGGLDAGIDAGADAGGDAGLDAGAEAGLDAGSDAGIDAGADAGLVRGDAGPNAGVDAGPGASDAGVGPGAGAGGCGCRSFGPEGAWSLVGLLALLQGGWRKRGKFRSS